MCPYCEKTFKTNVNCKKHMKTHIGSLTAQNPIGNYKFIIHVKLVKVVLYFFWRKCTYILLISVCTFFLGKYPPDVIIENPANLHSETVSSDLENNLKGANKCKLKHDLNDLQHLQILD